MATLSPTANGTGRDRRTTSVSVDDSETWVEAKRYTVYKVVVRAADRAYFVFRRSVGTVFLLTVNLIYTAEYNNLICVYALPRKRSPRGLCVQP